ncbi:MAG: hypothetical protein H6Q53_1140 [Deltaproteobacteria bacterium]|jgi:hypothetical protein|nr:hypothetical protein [Deltaproteobacteria bacterium]
MAFFQALHEINLLAAKQPVCHYEPSCFPRDSGGHKYSIRRSDWSVVEDGDVNEILLVGEITVL